MSRLSSMIEHTDDCPHLTGKCECGFDEMRAEYDRLIAIEKAAILAKERLQEFKNFAKDVRQNNGGWEEVSASVLWEPSDEDALEELCSALEAE